MEIRQNTMLHRHHPQLISEFSEFLDDVMTVNLAWKMDGKE